MSDGEAIKLAVGDEVRVHYHPPGASKSFVEGVVSRVDVTTLRGRVFVVDTATEVVLDKEQPVRPGYQNYIFYERWDEFPGRIERLSATERKFGSELALEPKAEPEVLLQVKPELSAERTQPDEQRIKLKPAVDPEPDPEPFQVEVEQQEGRKRGGLMAAIFRQRT